MVDEPILRDGRNRVGEYGRVVCYQRLKVAGPRSGATTAYIEVFGYYLINEARITGEFGSHFVVRMVSGAFGCFTSSDDELEALVRFVLNLFTVLEVLARVVLQILKLLFTICRISVSQ